MLILTRKPGESLYIGHDIRIVIVGIQGAQVRVGIEAPEEYRVYREEIYSQITEENALAAASSRLSKDDLGREHDARPPEVTALKSSKPAPSSSRSGLPSRSGLGNVRTGVVKSQSKEATVVYSRKKGPGKDG